MDPTTHLIFLFLLTVPDLICGQQQYGSHFIVTMPYGDKPLGSNSTRDIRIVLTNPTSATVDVTMTHNGQNKSTTKVLSMSSFIINLDSSSYALPDTTGIHTGVIILRAASNTDRFGVLVQGTLNYDGYMAIPVAQWGKAYTVATLCQGVNAANQIVVLAQTDNTVVKAFITSESNPFTVDESRPYAVADTLTQTLSKHDAWVIKYTYDLTGTVIVSNANVGVLAGAQWTRLENTEGAVTEQLPPLTALGQEYLSFGQGMCRVVTTEPNTVIRFSDKPAVMVKTPGQWIQWSTPSLTNIRSDRPVLAVWFGKFQSSSNPVFTILTPISQFCNSEESTVVPSMYVAQQVVWIVTRDKYKSSIEYGIQSLAQASGSSSSDLRSNYTAYFVNYGGSNAVRVKATGSGTSVMAVYTRVTGSDFASLSPLSARYDIVNPGKDCSPVTSQKAGDTVDNDCDGQADEDDCTAGNTGFDCAPSNTGPRDIWGRRFVAVIPDYLMLLNISLAFTTYSATSVQTTVHSPDTGDSTINFVNYISVPLSPSQSSAVSTERSRHVFRVTSDEDVSATYYASGGDNPPQTSGSMRLIPEESLGREYYVATVCETKNCHIQIVSVFPETSVAIRLKLLPEGSANVNFSGVSYENGDFIRVNVDDYEVLQLQCAHPCDMTGSRVSASKPVAVFSLSDLERIPSTSPGSDHFMEQMPPVEAYGFSFIVKQDISRFLHMNFCGTFSCYDIVWIVASEYDTTVSVVNSNSSGVWQSHHLHSAGDVLKFSLEGNLTKIDSDRTILVVQIFATLLEDDGAMLVVPPISQYTDRDFILFDKNGPSAVQVVFYTDDKSAPPLDIDGTSHAFIEPVQGPFFNLSSLVISNPVISNATNISLGSNGVFGGYFAQQGYEEMITSLSFSLEQINIPCIVTKPVRGDGIDNDCDGQTDEEPCDANVNQDGDGDGRINEDCEDLPESSSFFTSAPSTSAFTHSTAITSTETIVTTSTSPSTSWSRLYDTSSSITTFNATSTTLPATTDISDQSTLSGLVGTSSYDDVMTQPMFGFVSDSTLDSAKPSLAVSNIFPSSFSVSGAGSFSFGSAGLTSIPAAMSVSDVGESSLNFMLGSTADATSVFTYYSSQSRESSSFFTPAPSTSAFTHSTAINSTETIVTTSTSPSTSWSRLYDTSSSITTFTATSIALPTTTTISSAFWSGFSETSPFSESPIQFSSELVMMPSDVSSSSVMWTNLRSPQPSVVPSFTGSSLSRTDISERSTLSGLMGTSSYPDVITQPMFVFVPGSMLDLADSSLAVSSGLPSSFSVSGMGSLSFESQGITSINPTLSVSSVSESSSVFELGSTDDISRVLMTTHYSSTYRVTTTEPPNTTPQVTTQQEKTTQEETTTPIDTTPDDTTPDISASIAPSETTSTTSSASTSSNPTPNINPATTITTSSSRPPPSTLCGCNCPPWTVTGSVESASLTSVLNSIVKELTVDKSELSSVRRKKISVEDNRPSAQTVGYFGVAIIVATVLGIVVLDSGALYRDFKVGVSEHWQTIRATPNQSGPSKEGDLRAMP